MLLNGGFLVNARSDSKKIPEVEKYQISFYTNPSSAKSGIATVGKNWL